MHEYPEYQRWVAIMAQRDQGMQLIALLVIAASAWLVHARWLWHRWQRPVRVGLVVGFYLSFLILIYCSALVRLLGD